MHYGNIKYNAIEDGIGCRTVLFVSGCRNHCPHCFQQETWDFGYGKPFTNETMAEILRSLDPLHVRGLTLLGGEPFEPENQKPLLQLVELVKADHPDKDVWAYTGFVLEDMVTDPDCRANTPFVVPLLRHIDVLVDGPFVQERASRLLPFRGSDNQRVIDVKETFRTKQVVLSPYGERHGF